MQNYLNILGASQKKNKNPGQSITPFLFAILILLAGCKEEFSPPATSTAYNYLVVDGFINTGNETTNFSLSRTLKLKDSVSYRPEPGAVVSIEGDDGFMVTLQGDNAGNYSGGPYHFNGNSKYRLHIKTTGGKEYFSDFVAVANTPPIDSIGWDRTSDGVLIYLNTHGEASTPRYYHWQYEQTWEFHSAFQSTIKYENGNFVPRFNYDSIYTCWHAADSHELLLGSSAALSENVIYRQPILFIPKSSWQISVKYSVLIKQEAIDKATFDYMQLLRRVTEQSGSVFDVQPSTINGNIHCKNDRNEIAIGQVYAANHTEKRIFIDNSEVPGWNYRSGCLSFLVDGDLELVAAGYYIPIAETMRGILVTTDICGNCTLRGTHDKPVFWP